MLLAIDIGNTNIFLGVFDTTVSDDGKKNKSLVFSSGLSASVLRSPDEYAVVFSQLFTLHECSANSVDCVAVSSVVPHLTAAVCRGAEILTGASPYMIVPGIRTGFRIDVNDPATLGTDIVSNVAAALEIASAPIVIFDAGTANTLTFVDSSNSVAGTVISPGIRISLEALTDNAEQIETIIPSGRDIPLIGKTTFESISSGIVLGNAFMVDSFIRNIRENYLDREAGEKLSLIATGDYCELICRKTRNKFTFDKNLTLNGIASLYIKNNF